jgi:hypothetical protein
VHPSASQAQSFRTIPTQCKHYPSYEIKFTNFGSRRRKRESNLSAADIALEKAKAADRVAISQAIKAMKNSPAYIAASNSNKEKMEEEKREEVVNKR